MTDRTKRLALTACAVGALLVTSAMALRWNGEVRREQSLEQLIGELEAERKATPVFRDALYGETVEGSAWEHYALALECVEEIEDHRQPCWDMSRDDTDGNRAAVTELLSQTGDLFDHLKRGAHARDATPRMDWDGGVYAKPAVRLIQSQSMAQLVQVRAYQLIAEGRSVEAVHAMLDMQQFAGDAMMCPTQIQEMIGCGFVAPRRFRSAPVPEAAQLTEEGKRVWLEGVRKLKAQLPSVGRSYPGELELLARHLKAGRNLLYISWVNGSPGWRYGFSWEAVLTEHLLEAHGNTFAYRTAMRSPEGLASLAHMDKEARKSPNLAIGRFDNLRGLAINRRYARMRLGCLEHALALDLNLPSEKPTSPMGHPVTVQDTKELLSVLSVEPSSARFGFDLCR